MQLTATCLLAALCSAGPALAQDPEAPPAHARAAGPQEASIDPWVLHVDRESFTLAYATQQSSIGRVVVRSEFGEQEVSEASPTTHHKIVVGGLKPDTTYRYEVDGIHSGTLRTDATAVDIKFAVFGHPGGTVSPGAVPVGALAGVLDDLDPDLVLCTGDLCNCTSQRSFHDLFFEPFNPLARRRAIYATAGNHELGFPSRRGREYEVFRRVFPYDFPSDRGPFHTFSRGNVQFFAVSYLPIDKEDLAEQTEWLKRELQASKAEFRVAFLGGNNRDRKGYFESLVETMKDGGVDVIFGGDGTRSSHEKLSGIDYFFAGTNRLDPADFYLVESRPYELVVRKMNTSLDAKPEVWLLPSRRRREVTANLLPRLAVRAKNEAELVAYGINLPGEEADGIRLTLKNPTKERIYVRFHWAPSSLGNEPSASEMYRARVPVIEPGETRTIDFSIPDVDPLTGTPIALGSVEVRIQIGKKRDQRGVLKWIQQLDVFKDPLRAR